MANRRFIDFPIAASVGDNDIVLIWQDGLNKQTTKATLLQGSPQSLAGLTDVDIAGLTNGQILQYNSTLGKWENVDRTDINLSELGDVTIVAPTNGQVLVYNSSTSKWENSSGGYVPYTGAVTTVNLGAQSILAGSFVKAGGTSAQFLKADGSVDSTAYGTGSVTSVGLTMPSAFSVANTPVTTAGTLAVTGAGTVSQYIRGDGSLADFPATTGGGASVSYYLNGSVSQGTIGGVAYREVNRNPVFGAGTDITRNSDGYIASFITDAGDPNKLLIPAGNWNLETYFSASSGGGSPTFYVELYKYDGTTFTLIASSAAAPELIAFGTNLNPYFSTLAVPQTTLTLTDRLALRYYVNTSGRTITLHTENDHLCQVITTFTTGLTALNGLTSQVQFFAVGTSGTDFNIASATDTHTFNLPTASAVNRGALSSADWTTFNSKIGGTIASGQVAFGTAANTVGGDNGLFWDNTNKRLGVGITTPIARLNTYQVNGGGEAQTIFQNFSTTTDTTVALYLSPTNGNLTTGSIRSAFIKAINVGGGVTALTFGTNSSGADPTEKWRITSTGILQSNGAQTIQTSTGNLTLTSADNTGIVDIRRNDRTLGAELRLTNSFDASGWVVGDTIGTLNFVSSDTSTTQPIRSQIKSTVSGGGTYGTGVFLIFSTANFNTLTEGFRLTNTSNLLIGTTTDAGFRLDVNGTARVQGVLTTTADAVVNGVNIGIGAGAITTNTRIGASALRSNTTGASNTAIGFSSLFANTTGASNTAIGRNTLVANISGSNNTAIGHNSLVNLSSGSGNTALGSLSGRFIADGTTDLTTSENSVFIGGNSRPNANSETNQIAIGHTAIGLGSNTTVLGNSSTTHGRWYGNLLLGTNTNSTFLLDVNGTARFSGNLTVTATNATGDFATIDGSNIIRRRTAAQVLTDIGAQGALTNPVTGTGTSGQVAYFNGTTTITSESNLFWNATNDRLGIGTSSPSEDLTIQKASATSVFIGLKSNSSANQSYIGMDSGGLFQFQTNNGISFYTGSSFSRQVDIFGTGNVGINVAGTDAGFKLDVNGTGRFTQNLNIGAATAATNVKLIFNGVASKAAGIEFHQSGTPQWYIGNGIASEDNNFELYNSNGTMAMKIVKSTNAINFIGAATFSSSVTTNAANSFKISSGPYNAVFHNESTSTSDYNSIRVTQGAVGSATGYIGTGGSAVGNTSFQNTFVIGTQSNNALVLNTNDAERMRITSGGFVQVGAAVTARLGVRGFTNDSSGFAIEAANASGNTLFIVRNDGATTVSGKLLVNTFTPGSSPVRLISLPTSSAGLSSGDVWNDSGTLKIA
jgi:hypothetical protein